MTTKKTDAEAETRGSKEPTKRLVLRREKVRDLQVRTGVRTGTVFVNSPGTVRTGSESSSIFTSTTSSHVTSGPSTIGQSTPSFVVGGGG